MVLFLFSTIKKSPLPNKFITSSSALKLKGPEHYTQEYGFQLSTHGERSLLGVVFVNNKNTNNNK